MTRQGTERIGTGMGGANRNLFRDFAGASNVDGNDDSDNVNIALASGKGLGGNTSNVDIRTGVSSGVAQDGSIVLAVRFRM